MMQVAIRVLEVQRAEIDQGIEESDRAIADLRKQITSRKARLKVAYKSRDELTDAIDKLRRAR